MNIVEYTSKTSGERTIIFFPSAHTGPKMPDDRNILTALEDLNDPLPAGGLSKAPPGSIYYIPRKAQSYKDVDTEALFIRAKLLSARS